MNTPDPSRRRFLKTSALAGLGASLAGLSLGGGNAAAQTVAPPKEGADLGKVLPRPAGQKPVHALITNLLERVRVAVIGLHRGLTHVQAALDLEFADVIAVCDILDDRARQTADECE